MPRAVQGLWGRPCFLRGALRARSACCRCCIRLHTCQVRCCSRGLRLGAMHAACCLLLEGERQQRPNRASRPESRARTGQGRCSRHQRRLPLPLASPAAHACPLAAQPASSTRKPTSSLPSQSEPATVQGDCKLCPCIHTCTKAALALAARAAPAHLHSHMRPWRGDENYANGLLTVSFHTAYCLSARRPFSPAPLARTSASRVGWPRPPAPHAPPPIRCTRLLSSARP